jgi:hypothetical protein
MPRVTGTSGQPLVLGLGGPTTVEQPNWPPARPTTLEQSIINMETDRIINQDKIDKGVYPPLPPGMPELR